jgi:hypothetical protein
MDGLMMWVTQQTVFTPSGRAGVRAVFTPVQAVCHSLSPSTSGCLSHMAASVSPSPSDEPRCALRGGATPPPGSGLVLFDGSDCSTGVLCMPPRARSAAARLPRSAGAPGRCRRVRKACSPPDGRSTVSSTPHAHPCGACAPSCGGDTSFTQHFISLLSMLAEHQIRRPGPARGRAAPRGP